MLKSTMRIKKIGDATCHQRMVINDQCILLSQSYLLRINVSDGSGNLLLSTLPTLGGFFRLGKRNILCGDLDKIKHRAIQRLDLFG
jgi:hypothetical protein